MTTLELTIHGGGRLEIHGSLDAKRILVLLSRENVVRDDVVMQRLVQEFARRDLTVVRYDSAIAATSRLIDCPSQQRLPRRLQQAVKAVRLLGYPRHWRHFSGRYRRDRDRISYRCESLAALIRFLGESKEIILLTRSASGRVASCIADQAKVAKLICLGYPFQHPQEGPDPNRYAHLATLQTPCLILQGERDDYGGREIEGRHQLGPRTTMQWVDTDHGFALAESEWTRVLELIADFIGLPPR